MPEFWARVGALLVRMASTIGHLSWTSFGLVKIEIRKVDVGLWLCLFMYVGLTIIEKSYLITSMHLLARHVYVRDFGGGAGDGA